MGLASLRFLAAIASRKASAILPAPTHASLWKLKGASLDEGADGEAGALVEEETPPIERVSIIDLAGR